MKMKFGKRQLVLASLVLALGAAVYLNWQFTGVNKLPVKDGPESSEPTGELGVAQLVNNAYVETVSDDLKKKDAADVFAEARLERQSSRDEAMELLDSVLDSVDSDTDAKKEAVERASVIAQSILKETNVENLLKAKGYEKSVAYLSDGACSVVVAGKLEEADTLIIQEVVMEQTGLPADQIKIVGAN